MAVTTVALTAVPLYTPYGRPADAITLGTIIPRGLRRFVVNSGVLSAKAINDDELLTVTATLSRNFAYVLSSISMSIFQDVATSWDTRVGITLNNGTPGGAPGFRTQWVGALEDLDWSPIDDQTIFRTLSSIPTEPIWGGQSAATLVLSAVNTSDPAGAAGVVECSMSFWEYDLAQIQLYPVNTPIPVMQR